MKQKSTKLRYAFTKEKMPDKLIIFVNNFDTKVEIKSMPQKVGNKWFLFFILPDDSPNKKIPLSFNLDELI